MKARSPLVIMTQSRRFLEFDEEGRPVHPLLGQGVYVSLPRKSSEEPPRLGATFEVEAMVCCKQDVLLVRDGRSWRFPKGVEKKREGVEVCARRAACEEALGAPNSALDGVDARVVYSNMNNFDRRTTRNSWVETTVVKLEVTKEQAKGLELAKGAKWFRMSDLPRDMSKLHTILVTARP